LSDIDKSEFKVLRYGRKGIGNEYGNRDEKAQEENEFLLFHFWWEKQKKEKKKITDYGYHMGAGYAV